MDSPDLKSFPRSRSSNRSSRRRTSSAIRIFPRMIDLGQCNDAIVAVAIAQALAGLFGVLA